MRAFLPLLGILLASVVAGCAQPEIPQDHFYRLQVALPKTPGNTPALDGTIEIDRLIAEGLTAGRPIVYSDKRRPNELQEYHYHFWADPPAVMLRDQLVAYLRAAGVATAVVTPELRVKPDFVLAGKIKRLEKINGAPPGVVIEIEAGLRRVRDGKLILLRQYRIEKEARSATVAAAVAALNDAFTEICGAVARDIAGL